MLRSIYTIIVYILSIVSITVIFIYKNIYKFIYYNSLYTMLICYTMRIYLSYMLFNDDLKACKAM